MKKILVSILLLTISNFGFSQTNKTAYVDIYHILKKSPEYTEATLELEKRAKDWQTQISSKKAEIKKMKEVLATERALLTQQLVDEKDDEIQMIQTELNTLEHEKFGIEGAYFVQKENIYKPILDQIHTISNDIATKKKFDIVLIKSQENTMVYANKRNDITDLVLKEMERARTRGKMSKKEIAALEIQDKIEEKKERQYSQREMLKERQREIESGNFKPSNTSEANSQTETNISNETDIEKRIRQNKERAEEAKLKQQEIRESQLKKIEDQKIAIKKKQEEQRLLREKSVQDAIDKKNNISQNTNSKTPARELTQNQQQMLQMREQRVKEAKEKREKLLEERKIKIEKRKKEIEEERNKRLKDNQEAKDKNRKNIDDSKDKKQ